MNDLKIKEAWIIAPVKDTYPLENGARVAPFQEFIDTFDGAKPRFLNRGKKAPLSINPEHTPGFRPGSRMG